jgi:hypothetical protein
VCEQGLAVEASGTLRVARGSEDGMKRYYFNNYAVWNEVMALVGVALLIMCGWLLVVALTPNGGR